LRYFAWKIDELGDVDNFVNIKDASKEFSKMTCKQGWTQVKNTSTAGTSSPLSLLTGTQFFPNIPIWII